MRIKPPLILFLFLFFICNSLVLANFDYNQTGDYDNEFQRGFTRFNDALSSGKIKTIVKSINQQTQTPLVSDLDGDGINEIIILDTATFSLYHVDTFLQTLTGIDSYTLPSSERYSNFIIFNIDDDKYTEIIIVLEQSESLHILEYNGTEFYQEYTFDLSTLGNWTGGEALIGCEATNKCLMSYISDWTHSTPTKSKAYAVGFNTTNHSTSIFLDEGGINDALFCFPKIRTLSVIDLDDDGSLEFVFDLIEANIGDDEELHIFSVSLDNNLIATEELQISKEIGLSVVQGGSDPVSCDAVNFQIKGGNLKGAITPPLVFEATNVAGNNYIIVGAMKDADNYRIHSWDSSGNYLTHYPYIADGEGVIMSNVFRADVFSDSGNYDFCVMGYDYPSHKLEMVCASENTGRFPKTTSFFYNDLDKLYNISYGYDEWNVITHSIEADESNDYDEIVNSYGVWQLDYSGLLCAITHVCSFNLIWENPKQDAVVIPVDVEKIGLEDMLVLTSTNFWYIDDGFVNSPARIKGYYINPCIEATWKINTSLEVRIIAEDTDNDFVSARAILYYGHSNQQNSEWTINATSGTTFSFSDLKPNQTISAGTLRLMARDVVNPTTYDIIDLTFSVGINGVEFGDCITEVEVEEEEEEEAILECISDDDCLDGYLCIGSKCVQQGAEEDTITKGISDVSGLFGISSTILWIILMIVVAFVIWSNYTTKPEIAIGIVLIVELLLLIVGTLLGFINVGILISIIIICLIVIGMWLRKVFTGTGT